MRITVPSRRVQAFTLAELAVAMALTGMMVAAIVSGFLQAANQAEWSAYSFAAQAQALRSLEQVRAAPWDPMGSVDQVQTANFPPVVDILDVPASRNNIVWATNTTTITLITNRPPLKLVAVETTWRFMKRGLYTNSVRTYRTTDQ
jgi:type II secretory pathway pseudopilin PulG